MPMKTNPFSLADIFKQALAVPAAQTIEGLPPLLEGATVLGQIPESARPLLHMITISRKSIQENNARQGELRNQARQLGDTDSRIRLEVAQLSSTASLLEAACDAVGQVIGMVAYQTSQQAFTLPSSGHLMIVGDGTIVHMKASNSGRCPGCGGCHDSHPFSSDDDLDPDDSEEVGSNTASNDMPLNGHPFQAAGSGPAEPITVPANGDITSPADADGGEKKPEAGN